MEGVRATREEVKRFLSIEQPNCDYDYGCGYGFGDGSGPGYGIGNSAGFTTGNGYGYGNGCGSGYSYGCGCGEDGFIYYFGDGNIKTLNGNIIDYIDNVPTIITQVRGNIACGYIVKDDLTLIPCYIAKVGNSLAHGETLKDAVIDAEAKEILRIPIEERITRFIKVFGPLDSEHTGKEFYDWHHILTGSCRMGRDGFCRSHSIDLTQKYSVRYFLDITEEAYGSDVIKLIRKEYKI